MSRSPDSLRSIPARWIWRLAERLTPADRADEVLGDLLEQNAARKTHLGPTARDSDIALSVSALMLSLGLRAEIVRWLVRDRVSLDRHGSNGSTRRHHLATRSLRPLRQPMTRAATPPLQETTVSPSSAEPASIRSTMNGLGDLGTEIRQASRSLRRSPSLSAAVILTLTLGIAGTTGMFAVVRSVLLQPLPLPQPERLVRIGDRPASARQAAGLRDAEGIAGLTAVGVSSAVLVHEGRAVELRGLLVDGHHHRVFGRTPVLGRALEAGDDLPGATPVVVLAHDTWVRWFDADPNVLGRIVELDSTRGTTAEVVGVQSPDYRPLHWQTDFLMPHGFEVGGHEWQDEMRFWMVARLAEGASRLAATERLRSLASALATETGAFDTEGAGSLTVVGLLDARVSSVRERLWILFAVVLGVLAVGMSNVLHLFLVRGLSRRREAAIRNALGAGTGRLLRQTTVEGLLLASAGGILGALLASVGLPLILDTFPDLVPRAGEVRIDAGALTFSAALTVLLGIVFGLLSFSAARRPAGSGLSTRSGALHGGTQKILIGVQVACCTVLLSAGAVLAIALWDLDRTDPGFDIHNLVTLRVSPSTERYDEQARRVYFDEAEAEARRLPGIEAVGAISSVPLTPTRVGVGISPDGNPVPAGERSKIISYRAITPGYLGASGVPLLRGRNVGSSDRAGAPPVGLINQTLAEQLWPGEDPIGRELAWGTGEAWFTVIGVIGNVRQFDLATPSRAEAYLPYAQESWVGGMHLMVRSGQAVDVRRALRDAVATIDPLVPMGEGATMEQIRVRSMADERWNASLIGGLAGAGVLLAAIGLFGITLFLIAQRRSELGVRMALGADGRRIRRLVVASSLRPALAGALCGVALSLPTQRSIDSLLSTAPRWPLLTPMLAAAVLCVLALLVSLIASRRADTIHPSRVLSSQ